MKKTLLTAAIVLSSAMAYRLAHSQKAADAAKEDGKNVKTFTLVNLEYEGTKIWLPSLIVVKKGDRVNIKLINNAPSGEHGFSIPEFKVLERVAKGEPRTVEFVADKVGIYKMFCQIHPAHIGGQLLVLE